MNMKNQTLELSADLSLPIDAATQTFAFIGRKGSGKTYGAGKLAELLMDAGVQTVILDTVGNWYGLRIAADGKERGFDIPVLGGLRGDIPLEATGGELVADLVVDTGRSIIIDLSQFSLGDRKKFATAFGIRLWQRKKAETDPSPLHLVIEESQLIIPQFVGKDDARMVGIYEEIIRLGRNYGIGVSMITQRPQSVNKEVLTQTECLVVFQVNGTPERKALREWIVHQGEDVNLVDRLPSLHVGHAYVWSPQWLRILQQVKIAPKRTLDASSTPKVGVRRQQREMAPLDLDAFKEKMAATIERAKENDPREMQRTISQLKRELAQRPTAKAEIKEVPVLSKAEIFLLESLQKAISELHTKQIELSHPLCEVSRWILNLPKRFGSAPASRAPVSIPRPVVAVSNRSHQAAPTNGDPASQANLPKAERAILRVLANFPEGKTRREVGVIAGYKHSGGGFNNAVGSLRSKAYVAGSDPLKITEAGLTAYGPVEPLPTGQELFGYWMGHPDLGRAEREILRVLYESQQPMPKEEIAPLTISDRGTPYKPNGGGFNNGVGRLRTYNLVSTVPEGLQIRKEFLN